MDIGKLNRLIKIQLPSEGRDSLNQREKDWTDLASVWGSCVDLSGKEILAAQAVSSRVTSKVIIRYRVDVNASARLVIDAQVYEVEFVLIGGRNEFLTVMCRRG